MPSVIISHHEQQQVQHTICEGPCLPLEAPNPKPDLTDLRHTPYPARAPQAFPEWSDVMDTWGLLTAAHPT